MSIENSPSRSPRVSTKGSTIVHTGTTTAEIAIGSNSTYLIANSSVSVGINWATTAAFAAPKIESIYSNTTTAAVTSVDITNIPQTYEGLMIEISNASTTAVTTGSIQITFNSSSASYWFISGSADSSGASFNRGRDTSSITLDHAIGGSSYTSVISGGSPGSGSIQIPGYRTNKNKSVGFDNRAAQWIDTGGGTWKNTTAINRILITFSSTVASGLNVTLYGTNA